MTLSTTRRSTVWLVVASLFTIINVVGVLPAVLAGEGPHAGVHVVLALVGAYWVRRVWRSGRPEAPPALADDYSDRLTHLEQNIDAVAVEVERIGEGQRFMTRVLTEKPSQQKAAESIENKPRKPE